MNAKNNMSIGEELIGAKQVINPNNDLYKYDTFVINHYLKKKLYFYDKEDADHIYELYGNLFSLLINVSIPDFISKDNDHSLFVRIMNKIEESEKIIPIIVKSRAGHGKTEFLSVLYQFLKRQYNNSNFNSFPIYISLHHYNKTIYKNAKRFSKQAKESLYSDITPLLNYLKNSSACSKVLLIIDGPDEFRYQKVELEEELLERFNIEFPNNIQIIGLRQHIDKHKIAYRSEKNIDAEIEIQLDKISVTSPGFTSLIKNFVEIEKSLGLTKHPSALEEYILRTIKNLSLKHIDMFHLFLLSKNHRESEYIGIKTIGSLYEHYIKRCDIDLEAISTMAFKMYNQPGNISNEEKNTKLWWKLQKHDSLRDFLAAYYIANMLINYSSQEPSSQDVSIFNYVYPYDINSYCKDIINEDKDSEKAAYETIMCLYNNAQITARTHFCYLLGRFTNRDIKDKATNFLLQEEKDAFGKIDSRIQSIESLQKSSKSDRQRLLFYRTICISLICLGNNEITSKYITQMIKNKHLDNLNRGFHLEYYEDIVLPLTSQSDLLHDDDLCDFPKTYDRLSSKIKDAVYRGKTYPLFPVELYTLCSLIQHRQESRKYFEAIDDVIKVLEDVNSSSIVIPDNLKEYLNLCYIYFQQKENFRVCSFVKEIYTLKQLRRKGWINRDINTPETVASHSWGTLLLAYLYLPTILVNYKEYDKDLIIRMLIVHDMGEAYIGDLTPKEKSEKHRTLEAICFNYISLMGTYAAINSTDIYELFNMFTHGTDINSQIARDLDKLDNLLQLHIYQKELSDDDFNNFKLNLEEAIKTKIGKQIEEQIYEMFNTQGVGIKPIIDNYKNQHHM